MVGVRYFGMLVFLVLTLSCGKYGTGGVKTTKPSEESDEETQPLSQLIGSLSVNSAGAAAENYPLVLQNETTGQVKIFYVDRLGNFAVDVGELDAGEIYSLHILDEDFQYLTPIYFEGATDFTWQGEQGYSLGDLIVVRDSFGLIDPGSSSVQASAGSNLTPVANSTAALGVVTNPMLGVQLNFGGELLSFDPRGVLFGHHLREQYPTAHAVDLLEHSRVWIKGTGTNLTVASVSAGGSWLLASLWASTDATVRAQAQDWRRFNANSLSANEAGDLEAHVFPGTNVPTGSALAVTMIASDMPVTVMTKYADTITSPPLVYAAQQGTEPQTVFDYTDNDQQNGLTIPLCRSSGDLALELHWPKGGELTDLDAAVFQAATLKLAYYGPNAEGDEVEITPVPADYAGAYQNNLTESIPGVGSLVWSPSERKLTTDITNQNQSRMALHIPTELLLDNVTSTATVISRTELQLVVSGSSLRAGSIFVLESCLK